MDANPVISLTDSSTRQLSPDIENPAPSAPAASTATQRRREWLQNQLDALRKSSWACSRGHFALQTSLLEAELKKLSGSDA